MIGLFAISSNFLSWYIFNINKVLKMFFLKTVMFERNKLTLGFVMNVTSELRSHWGRRLRKCPTWKVIDGAREVQAGKFSLPHQWRSVPSLCRISWEVSQSFHRKCWSELSDRSPRPELGEIFHIAGKERPRNIKFLITVYWQVSSKSPVNL